MLITAEAEEGSWPQLTRERNPELESCAHLSFLGPRQAADAMAGGKKLPRRGSRRSLKSPADRRAGGRSRRNAWTLIGQHCGHVTSLLASDWPIELKELGHCLVPLAVEVKCKFTIVNNVFLNIKFISYKVNSSLIDDHIVYIYRCYIFCFCKRF